MVPETYTTVTVYITIVHIIYVYNSIIFYNVFNLLFNSFSNRFHFTDRRPNIVGQQSGLFERSEMPAVRHFRGSDQVDVFMV